MTPTVTAPIRIAVVGVGKIARDQHLPAIAAQPALELAATADPTGKADNVPAFPDLSSLLAAKIPLDAVALCTPPQVRYAIACTAIDAGLHVMLEKPPAATLSEVEDLARRAEARGVTLFASWHSRQASGVEQARAWLSSRQINQARLTWKEDIRRWHPGQQWILDAGGMGIFDPGINALSILTRIVSGPVFVDGGEFDIPEGRQSPIAARLKLRTGSAPISADLDFRETGPQQWDITVETNDGILALHDGGETLVIAGVETKGRNEEYPRLYARFVELIGTSRSDVDVTPLRLIADAFLVAQRRSVPSYDF